jgi:hypothetical protein
MKCTMSHEKYKCITKTKAKTSFYLNDADLEELKYIERDNPNYKKAAPMRLYLYSDVIAIRDLKYSNFEHVKQYKEQLKKDKLQKKEKKNDR